MSGNRNLPLAILCGISSGRIFFWRDQDALVVSIAGVRAGAWFTVEEVLERLRKGAIDVHFLMLALLQAQPPLVPGLKVRRCSFCFRFPARSNITRWVARNVKFIRCSRTRQSSRRCWTNRDANGNSRGALRPGMKLLVKPGAQFSRGRGNLERHDARMNRISTGESAPVEKKIGDTALAGTMNLWGAVGSFCFAFCEGSSLQKIIRLIQDAQHLKAPAQRFTDKFGSRYTYAVLTMTFVMFFVGAGSGISILSRGASCSLSHDDAARRRVALRAGAFDSLGGAGGDSMGRAARHFVSRRRGG